MTGGAFRKRVISFMFLTLKNLVGDYGKGICKNGREFKMLPIH